MKLPSKVKFLPLKYSSISKTCIQMGVISAPLGMMLDNQHGLFDVLVYHALQLTAYLPGASEPILKSALWVPPLFFFAGYVMSVIILMSDEILNTKADIRSPSVPKLLYSISFFSAQYYLSGLLDNIGTESNLIHIILIVTASLGYFIFDRSKAGFLLGTLTMISGPLAELGIINLTHTYEYSHQDFYGIDRWIPWVYFLGEIGVGNLARLLQDINSNSIDEKELVI